MLLLYKKEKEKEKEKEKKSLLSYTEWVLQELLSLIKYTEKSCMIGVRLSR